jgi:hypothetical protein
MPVGVHGGSVGSNPALLFRDGRQSKLSLLLSPVLPGLWRMPEELHHNLTVPGSSPGGRETHVAQWVEQQTARGIEQVVSQLFVATSLKEERIYG